jgi:hypothetical protein
MAAALHACDESIVEKKWMPVFRKSDAISKKPRARAIPE